MADKQVETKVVQVRFDNSKFSKKINKTIKECEKFDKSLQFKGSKNNIRDIQKALDEIDLKDKNKELNKTEGALQKLTFSFKELVKIKLLSKAMDVVINKTNTMIKSMLGINNVVAGWQQYETQLTNVGGILNQVESKGYDLEDVVDAMDRLQWYTDETSFSFTTLSNGIRQFVIAGIDLNKATEAAMGVTNIAGSAKVFDQYKVQSAMDAVSKAMQTGYMDLQKWTTLSNTAGIVTEELSQALIDEAVAQGKLIKSSGGYYKTKKSGKTVTTENIGSTLKDRWATQSVWENVLNRYASASTAVEQFSNLIEEQTTDNLSAINELFKTADKQFEGFSSWEDLLTRSTKDGVSAFEDIEDVTEMTARQTGIVLEKLGYKFDEVSLKAFRSSQETTSFSQALQSVTAAVTTKWSSIFKAIFGDYDKATELWSDVADKFYDIFVSPFDSLSEVFSDWSTFTEGGAEDFRKILLSIIDIVGQFKDAVASGFKAVFGSIDASLLQKITLVLKNFFERISEGFKVVKDEEGNIVEKGPLFKMVEALSKVFSSLLKIVGKLSSTVFKIIGKLFVGLEPVLDILIDILDYVADGLIWLIDTIDELGIFEMIIKGITTVLGWLANGIKNVVNWIKGKVDLQKVVEKLAKAFGYLKIAIEWIIDKFVKAGTAIKDWWNENEIAQKTLDFFKSAIESTKNAFSGFKKSANEASESIDELGESLENTAESGEKYTHGKSWLIAVENLFTSIGQVFKKAWGTFVQFLQDKGVLDVLAKIWEGIKEVFTPIIDTIVNWWKQLGEMAKEDPSEALKTILKTIATIIGIFLLIQATGIISAGKDTLWEIYGTLRAFRKKLLAERWKALASAVLILSASIAVLVFAIQTLSNIPAKEAWKGVGIIGAILVAYAGILALMNAPIFQTHLRTGITMSMQFAALAIGIALFMKALMKAINIVKGESQSDIWLAYGLIAAMTGLLVFVSMFFFKKVEKTGLFKGEYIKGPSLMMMLKTFLLIFGILKLVMWFVEKVNDFETDQLKLAIKVAGVILASIVVLLLTMKVLGKIFSKKTGIEKITHKWVTVNIGSLAMVALAAYYVLTKGSQLKDEEIKNGTLALLSIFGSIGIVLVAVGVMNKIASKNDVKTIGLKIGKTMVSIALSVLICVAAFKMIDHITWSEVWQGALFIMGLYVVIGAIAIALGSISKTVEIAIGKDGMKKVGATSPSGKMLLAISSLVLVCVFATKLLHEMKWEEFKDGLIKLSWIIGIVAGVSLAILVASKFANGNNVIKAVASLFAGVLAAILVAVAVKYWIDPKDLWIGYGIIAAFGAFLLAFTAIVNVINKYLKTSLNKTKSFALMTFVLIASIWAILGAIILINKKLGGEENGINWGVTLGVIALCIAVVSILVEAVLLMAKKSKNVTKVNQKTMVVMTACVAMLVGLVGVVVGLVAAASAIPETKVWRAMAIVGVCIAAVLVILTAVVGVMAVMKKMGKDNKEIIKDTVIIISIVAAFAAAVGIIVASLIAVSRIDSGKAWSAMGIIGIIAAGLVVMLLAVLGLIKIFKMGDLNPEILKSIALLFIGFGASILLIALSMQMISEVAKDEEAFKKAAIATGVIAAVVVAIILAVMVIASKAGENSDLDKRLLMTTFMLLSIGATFLMIAGALKLISTIPEKDMERAADISTILIAVLSGVMIALIMLAKTDTKAIMYSVAAMGTIALALLAMAGAIAIIASIDPARCLLAAGVMIVLLILFKAIIIALGALGSSGIGWVGVALLLAIGAAAVLLSTSVLILSVAIDKMVNSIIKLMNELTPSKIANIIAFGAALGVLAAGTMVMGFANLASSIMEFQASIYQLGTTVNKFISGGIRKLGEWLGFDMRSDSEKEIDALKEKAKAMEIYAKSLSKIDKLDADSLIEKVNTISSAIAESLLVGLSFKDKVFGKETVLDYFINNLERLKELLEDMPDPVITPVLDLTEFNKGIEAIKNGNYNVRAKLYDNYAPVASMPSMSSIKEANNSNNTANANGVGNKAEAITINQEFMINDAMAISYDTLRATKNAIDRANASLQTK